MKKANVNLGKLEFLGNSLTKHITITITRKLGFDYLWIDSLCIVQDDIEDWKHESASMEGVYTSAYCTVAATSAVVAAWAFA